MRTLAEIKSIKWKTDAKLINLTQEEFYNVYNDFRENGQEAYDNYDPYEWTKAKKVYRVDTKGKYTYLFTYSKSNYKQYGCIFVIYSTNNFDDSKNRHTTENNGMRASIMVERRFKELYGITLRGAFGYSDEEIKYCVPRQFYFTNLKLLGYTGCASAIDVCSEYPSAMCGTLPDWHTRVERTGRVRPTKEYPFAFYIKSGHCAEYMSYDTHNWDNHRLFMCLSDKPYVPDDKDITILCKASAYTLTDVLQYYFDLKCKGDADAKLVMNAFIGNCHTNKYNVFKLAHLAAVCIARANCSLLSLCDKIQLKNIIQVCVDGIIYKGDNKYGTDRKYLGSIKQEFIGCEIYLKGMNNYIVRENGKFTMARHSGCNQWDDGRKITDNLINEIKNIDDCEHWVRVDYLEGIPNGKKL